MSGGAFNYEQYKIDYIADQIQDYIDRNPERLEDGYGFSAKTLEEFQVAVDFLKVAAIYAQRIDWLVSGDDSEETFHIRLEEELNEQDYE